MKKVFVISFFSFALFVLGFLFVFSLIFPLKHQDLIKTCAKHYDLSPSLVASVINVESGFNSNALSKAGAVGLMQLLQTTANWLENKQVDLFDPGQNILAGCHYLKLLISQFQSLKTALAAYNAGPNNVVGWLKDKNFSSDGIELDAIPFKETENYVKKVLREQKVYEFLIR